MGKTRTARTSGVEVAVYGPSFDTFLEEEGILEECEATAIKRVIAWELSEHMRQTHASKTAIAAMLGTSRTMVNRLLDEGDTSITLTTMLKIARLTGKPVQRFFDAGSMHCPA